MDKYSLVGVDGNAFAIMGYVRKAMRKEGCTREEIELYTTEAKSRDYGHLLVTSVGMIDDLNDRARLKEG